MTNRFDPLGDLKPLIEEAKKRRRLRNKLGAGAIGIAAIGGLIYKVIDDRDGVDPRPPSAICWDSTYSYSTRRSGTCAGHGGVRQWLKPPDSFPASNPKR